MILCVFIVEFLGFGGSQGTFQAKHNWAELSLNTLNTCGKHTVWRSKGQRQQTNQQYACDSEATVKAAQWVSKNEGEQTGTKKWPQGWRRLREFGFTGNQTELLWSLEKSSNSSTVQAQQHSNILSTVLWKLHITALHSVFTEAEQFHHLYRSIRCKHQDCLLV